jgi:hypothetical protein
MERLDVEMAKSRARRLTAGQIQGGTGMKLQRAEKLNQGIHALADGVGRLLVDAFHYLALFAIGAVIVCVGGPSHSSGWLPTRVTHRSTTSSCSSSISSWGRWSDLLQDQPHAGALSHLRRDDGPDADSHRRRAGAPSPRRRIVYVSVESSCWRWQRS